MKEVKIKLYKFEELDEQAKEKAIIEHKDFLDSLPEEYENEKGEMVEKYINHKEYIVIESIEINEYYFFKNGDMAYCTTYTGNHNKAGKTEFKFKGEVYEVL